MRFKLDENLGSRTLDRFMARGHDVETVVQEGLSGASDSALYEVCRKEQRCIVTLDLDFSDVTRFPPDAAAGIAVLRLPKGASPVMLVGLVDRLLRGAALDPVHGRLWIVESTRIRVHAGIEESGP